MKDRLTELLYRSIGQANDIEQAAHIELFAGAIQDACKMGDFEGQYYYIAKHLGPKGKEFIKYMNMCLDRRESQAHDEVSA
jgi:hypothetical protein